MRIFLQFSILLMIAQPVLSQHTIEGTIFDRETGESLPSATILIQNTYQGTISNTEGEFSISVDELPISILVRYIGYNSEIVEVSDQTLMPLKVALNPAITEMDEVIVTDRDPGLSIMERVIARKQLWRAGLENYRVQAYTRQSIRSDTAIVSISESSSVAYWDKDEGHREIQLSTRQTMNLTENENFAGVRYLPNFYDDDIEIAGYDVVGITHPDALRFYHFKLIETTVMDDKPVYKIEVEPRRQRQPLFEGTVYVLGRDYALLEVDLKPNDVVNFPPPIQDFNLAYKQQFSNYDGDYWLPVDMRIEGRIRIGMVGLRFPAMNFRQVSRLSGYEVNTAIPDSIFNEDDWFSRVDSTTKNLDQFEYIEQIPLTEEEDQAYNSIDSTKTLEQAFKPEGFLANMIDSEEDSEGDGFFSTLSNYLPDGLGFRGRLNRVDGFHIGLKYQHQIDRTKTTLTGSGGYSFHSEEWDSGLQFAQVIYSKDDVEVELISGFEQTTDTRYFSELYSQGMNSASALIGGEDYYDYFRTEKVYLGFEISDLFPQTSVLMAGNIESHQSFIPGEEFDYTFFGIQNLKRDNREITEGKLHSISTTISVNKERNLGFTGNNGFELMGEFSDPILGSDFTFLKVSASVDLNIPTFYQRRLFANSLDVHLAGSISTGDLPLQRFSLIDGSMSRFTPFGSLKTRNYIPYEGDRHWLITAEHNFRTIPFEIIGLTPLVDRGWGIILFGGAGYSDARGNYPTDLMISEGIHTEIGLSLNSVFGVARIDFAKRLDRKGTFVGVSIPRYF